MRRIILMFLVVLAVGGSLAACGKKGPLQPPPETEEKQRS